MMVVFENASRVREITGFNCCKSLLEIGIPGSVEILNGFNKCLKLTTITFAPNSWLREIEGFDKGLVDSIEFPASVESIRWLGRASLSQLIFTEGTMIKFIETRDCCKEVSRSAQRMFVI
jgi:hypothetical protein